MAQKATLVILFLVFAVAIFIHYLLTNVEAFKNKKRAGKKSRSSKNRMGKKSRSSGGGSSGMKFSDVIGSLLSPSLPDTRDLKDKLFAPADLANACNIPPRNCNIVNTNSSLNKCIGNTNNVNGCNSMNPSNDNCTSKSNVASGAMPYVTNMNDYIKKDSIPCYGCNP
jgi:hypothetical protein